jgi:hypothetical protein
VLPDHRWRTCVRPAQLMMLEHVCKLSCGANQKCSSIIYKIAGKVLSVLARRT